MGYKSQLCSSKQWTKNKIGKTKPRIREHSSGFVIGEAKFTGWAVTVTYSDLRDGDHTKQKHSVIQKKTRIVALRHTIKIPTMITKHTSAPLNMGKSGGSTSPCCL